MEEIGNGEQGDSTAQYDEYLDKLEDEYLYGKDDVEKVKGFLAKPETISPTIDQTLISLNRFAVDQKTTTNDRVRKGLTTLATYFKQKESLFKMFGINVYVYGSMRYDDPRNMDYDVLVASSSHFPIIGQQVHEWDRELVDIWKEVGEEGHVSYASIDDIQESSMLPVPKSIDYPTARRMYWAGENAGVILAGNPLVASVDTVKGQRARINSLIPHSPLLGAQIAVNLQDVLRIREERRTQSSPR